MNTAAQPIFQLLVKIAAAPALVLVQREITWIGIGVLSISVGRTTLAGSACLLRVAAPFTPPAHYSRSP